MRVPLSWLRDYVDIQLTPEQLAERLTLLGMEVKGMEAWGADSFWGAKNLFTQLVATVLPFLKAFDLRNLTVFSVIRMPGTEFANITRYPTAVPLSAIFSNVAAAALYAVGYVTFAFGS